MIDLAPLLHDAQQWAQPMLDQLPGLWNQFISHAGPVIGPLVGVMASMSLLMDG